jgi:glutamyl-tRNA reductase
MRENRKSRKTLPLALLLEGRACLVVGGGLVAGRKAEALLEAGAAVTIVAPVPGDRVKELLAADRVTVWQRAYEPGDLALRPFLVVTATDDFELNRSILEACKKMGILCACPDRGWEQGDFISPASFRQGDLTVSVSTGGASCRRSRLVKEHLARHAESLGSVELLVLGVDHRFADLAQRESVHLSGELLARTGGMLRQVLGLHEFMVLCTCNRLELIAVAAVTPALLNVVDRLLGLDRIGGPAYTHRGPEAFRHLAEVAAGLLSQTPGETHIGAQLKEALEGSRRAGWSAGVLQDWVGRALHLGREIRQAVAPLLLAGDIEDLALAYLESEIGGLAGRPVLVLGAGAVGKAMAAKLAARGACATCCYRSARPVFEEAGPIACRPIAELDGLLAGHAIVIGAAACEKPILTAEHARRLAGGRAAVVVDLGVPRNTAPDFAADGNVTVVDIDGLKAWRRGDAAALEAALGEAGRIVREHQGEYERIVAAF